MPFDNEFFDKKRILRLQTVMDVTGLSRSSIYEKMAQGEFPKPVKLGPRSVGWIAGDIEEHLDQLAAKKGE
jgi:prophage regulatory protein